MNGIELVKEYFPDVSDDVANDILWGRTGFPSFFVGDAEQHFRRQLGEFYAALWKHPDKRLCDFCNEPALKDDWNCKHCGDALAKAGARYVAGEG